MSDTLDKVRNLASQRKVAVAQHSLFRIGQRGISIREVVAGVAAGEVIEDYPDYHKGPTVLVLQNDGAGRRLHVVWGIAKGTDEPAVVVTAYYPDPAYWDADFRSRKP